MDVPLLQHLDLASRAGVVVLALFLAALVWRDQSRTAAGRLAAALAVGVAAYALQSHPAFPAWPAGWRAPVAMLSTGNAVVFWLFTRALFDDDFRWQPLHGALWGVLAGAALVGCVAGVQPALGFAITVATIAFALLAVGQSILSWRADLVEGRRRLRVFIVAAGAAYTVAQAVPRLLVAGPLPPWAGPLDMLALAAITAAVGWHLLRVPGSPWQPPEPGPVEAPRPTPEVAPVDTALVARLEAAMRTDRLHCEEGLTLAGLAARLEVPEYRLRRAINQGLGHRNFNAFLNRYRLDEAKAALADPARAPVPVLTIALDAGFQSLGPFNRAFKADTGLTPTEFRKAQGA